MTIHQERTLKNLNIQRNSYDILVSSLYHAIEHDLPLDEIPVISSIKNLSRTDRDTLYSDAKPVIDVMDLPFEVQESIEKRDRKNRAAFYTGKEASLGMAESIKHLTWGDLVICDPFCGAGTLLSTVVKDLLKAGKKVKKVYGFEIDPLSAMVAYISTCAALDWDYHKLTVIPGDSFGTVVRNFTGGGLFGFNIFEKPNVIITNPPYLPWSKIQDSIRMTADRFLANNGYVDLTGSSFTAYSVLLCDTILKNGGYCGMVLPLSIFYNENHEVALNMFLERYNVKAILARNNFKIPYALKCTATDVLFVALKEKSGGEFYSGMVDDDVMMKMMKRIKKMDVYTPETFENVSDFGKRNLSSYIVEHDLAKYLDSLKIDKITTGMDIYHQQGSFPTPVKMWFIPNDRWKIKDDNERNLIISSGVEDLTISKRKLIPVFLKPMFSKGTSVAECSHYGIGFFKTLEEDERKYLESWNVRRNGDWWTGYTSQVNRSVWTNLNLSRVLNLHVAYYAGVGFWVPEKNPPTSAFIRATTGNELDDKVLCSWYNSLPFMAYLMAFGRRLSQDALYITVRDYMRLPVPKLDLMTIKEKEKFASHLDLLEDVPKFWKSIPRSWDHDWFRWLDLDQEIADEMASKVISSRLRWFPNLNRSDA